MSSDIFTRKARELIFHNKIQQSSIDFTRLNNIKRSNRSTKQIIIIGIGKITQFGIVLRDRDKQSNTQETKKQAKERGDWEREGE